MRTEDLDEDSPYSSVAENSAYPNRPFFVESETLEGKHARVFCPECKKKHDVTSLTEALEGGWLDLQSSHFDDEHAQGFVVDPRVLLTNAIRWIREAGPQVNRRGGITAV